MPVRIPLFPLSMVLFPHMPATLHIFEERYREMMRDCQAQGTSFGIVAVRDGAEQAAGMPHRVGTLAQIHQLDRLDDGRYNLVVAGASRFRIDRLVLDQAYLVGEVVYLEDRDGDRHQVPALAARVAASFRAYMDGLHRLNPDDATDEVELPDDPELLSYLVAASLDVELPRRQQLLEEDSTSGRLSRCLAALRRENLFLDHMLAHHDRRLVSVSLN
ncbi:MAG: LON peptidase substrate-binding domain-containing protein [Candidatus Dormibacteria bacterium]